MHLLLPPSEGKRPGGRGRPLRDRPLDGPLGAARRQALGALEALVGGPAGHAAEALLLPPATVAGALATNAAVMDSPTTPALRRYSGVVYDGMGVAGLSAAAQRVAGRTVLIFSGLFGVVRGDEPVPEYRVPAKAVLPGLGVAGTYWRPVLQAELPPLLRSGLVVDLRSSDYAAMWRPHGEVAGRVLSVRVLSPTPGGGRAVVSYPSKWAKGRLCAALVTRVAEGGRVRDAADVADTWLAAGGKGCDDSTAGQLVLFTG